MSQRSNSKQEDERREAEQPSRVNKTHGGTVVESIAPEDLESFNDADCKHERFIRDPNEKTYNAFICANPDCHEVLLYAKVK